MKTITNELSAKTITTMLKNAANGVNKSTLELSRLCYEIANCKDCKVTQKSIGGIIDKAQSQVNAYINAYKYLDENNIIALVDGGKRFKVDNIVFISNHSELFDLVDKDGNKWVVDTLLNLSFAELKALLKDGTKNETKKIIVTYNGVEYEINENTFLKSAKKIEK